MKKLLTILLLASSSLLYADVTYNNGIKQYQAKEYTLAIKSFYVSARHNNTNAYLMLGKMHEEALGTGANYYTAFYWYEKSAQRDHPTAQYRLAHLYEEGLGVKKNLKKAKVWYQKAARNGNKEARIKLAQGVSQPQKSQAKEDDGFFSSLWSNESAKEESIKTQNKDINSTSLESKSDENTSSEDDNKSFTDIMGFWK